MSAQSPAAEAAKKKAAELRRDLLSHDSDAGIGLSIRRTRQLARAGKVIEDPALSNIAELQQLRSVYLNSLMPRTTIGAGIFRRQTPYLWYPNVNRGRFSVGVRTHDGLWRP